MLWITAVLCITVIVTLAFGSCQLACPAQLQNMLEILSIWQADHPDAAIGHLQGLRGKNVFRR
jgi:hypothetical protein